MFEQNVIIYPAISGVGHRDAQTTEIVMNQSTIRHIKSLAKRLKKENKSFSHCQCLDLVSQQLYGVRHFHELQNTACFAKIIKPSIPTKTQTDIRCNDWPYFHIPDFNQSNIKSIKNTLHV